MEKSQSNGIGFPGTLTIAFIVLKLTHVITWSYWWVLSPLWIGFAFIGCTLVVAFIVLYLREALYDRRTWRRRKRL